MMNCIPMTQPTIMLKITKFSPTWLSNRIWAYHVTGGAFQKLIIEVIYLFLTFTPFFILKPLQFRFKSLLFEEKLLHVFFYLILYLFFLVSSKIYNFYKINNHRLPNKVKTETKIGPAVRETHMLGDKYK